MDKENLKLIVRNLESLINCLKTELDLETSSHKSEVRYEEIAPHITDYDEIFYDDDEYAN